MSALEKIGIICIALILYRLFKFLFGLTYSSVLAPLLRLNFNFKKLKGNYAVITGATDGIGKAYAEKLAKYGLNIVLISRSKEKLLDLAEEIRVNSNVETKYIEADLSDISEENFQNIKEGLEGLEIAVLVNNVGMSYSYPEYFTEVPEGSKLFNNIIHINNVIMTQLNLLILPGMIERKKGVVINISSTAALIPNPLLSVYSASKAYVETLSRNLRYELKPHGIIVQCVAPGLVATKMAKIRRATWMAPTPELFVESALKRVGVESETTGYLPHTLLVITMKSLMCISENFTVWLTKRTMENVRKRALRKATGT